MPRLRVLAPLLVALVALAAAPRDAHAGPSASGQVSTGSGASGSSSGGRYDWPDLVVGGNGLSFIAPFQIGAVGYLPKGRFTFQYDRQISATLARHWIHAGVGLLFDRGDFNNFRMDSCGLDDGRDGVCGKGGVVGYDLYAGYTHRFFINKRPYIVPHLKGSLGFAWWAYPRVGGGREERQQIRTKSWTLNLRPGGGLRVFLLDQLGVGVDVNIPFGFLIHTDIPDGASSADKNAGFLLGFETMLAGEFRF